MFSGVRRTRRTIDVWPGYVDVLSALLMVVIFVLMIFSLAQFLLSELLSTKEDELVALHRRVDELAELLGLEKQRNEELGGQVTELSGLITQLTEDKFELAGRVEDLTRQSQADQSQIRQQLGTIASLQEDIDALRRLREDLESQVGALAVTLRSSAEENRSLRDRSKALEARLATEEERTLLAQKAIEERDVRLQALAALVGEQSQELKAERELSASARAEVALLNQRILDLKSQLEDISRALAVSEEEKRDQAAKLEDLGKRLSVALAQRVSKLEQYRSEFFGRLREVLGDNPAVRVVGDRFVLQSELLFASGSAQLGEGGKQQLTKLAGTLNAIAMRIPGDIDWILRIDGHTDKVPIKTRRYPSNWDLSTARAVSVVRFLQQQGIPANRMSAAGFGEFHPIDEADTPAAYRRNRRIEIKLTAR